MTCRDDTPHLALICKDSSQWFLPLAARDSVIPAWQRGEAFWEGTGLWGEYCFVKLGDITGAMIRTEERADRTLRGDTA